MLSISLLALSKSHISFFFGDFTERYASILYVSWLSFFTASEARLNLLPSPCFETNSLCSLTRFWASSVQYVSHFVRSKSSVGLTTLIIGIVAPAPVPPAPINSIGSISIIRKMTAPPTATFFTSSVARLVISLRNCCLTSLSLNTWKTFFRLSSYNLCFFFVSKPLS